MRFSLFILCWLISTNAGAFLECREVKKNEKCKSGETRNDFIDQRMGQTPKPVYRCCKDSCDAR